MLGFRPNSVGLWMLISGSEIVGKACAQLPWFLNTTFFECHLTNCIWIGLFEPVSVVLTVTGLNEFCIVPSQMCFFSMNGPWFNGALLMVLLGTICTKYE